MGAVGSAIPSDPANAVADKGTMTIAAKPLRTQNRVQACQGRVKVAVDQDVPEFDGPGDLRLRCRPTNLLHRRAVGLRSNPHYGAGLFVV